MFAKLGGVWRHASHSQDVRAHMRKNQLNMTREARQGVVGVGGGHTCTLLSGTAILRKMTRRDKNPTGMRVLE